MSFGFSGSPPAFLANEIWWYDDCVELHTEKALISILIATVSLLLKSQLTVNVFVLKNTIQNCNTIQNSHVARNFKEEPEFYTGTFWGKYTAQTSTT